MTLGAVASRSCLDTGWRNEVATERERERESRICSRVGLTKRVERHVPGGNSPGGTTLGTVERVGKRKALVVRPRVEEIGQPLSE